MTIEEYVSKDEYLTRYEKRTEYKGYTVYEAWRSEDEGACTGYPCYLFVAGDTVRSATLEEINQVMDLLCTDEDFKKWELEPFELED